MKKTILLLSVFASTLSFAQECADVVDSSGINVISSNGAYVTTSGAAADCDKNAPVTTAKAPELKPEEKIVLIKALEGVKFKTDSDELLKKSYPKLDAVAELMKSHDDFKLVINGYTDNTGTSEYNHTLSHKRADAAKARLIEDGISADRITTNGYGEENPIATNDTEEGRAKNRRVEFKVTF
ncbi:OmpA family protein [Wenyingzhuangia sp. IMCC45533]